MNRTILTLGAALAALASPAFAANLLTNGSFEQPGGASVRDQLTPGYVPGWTYGSFSSSYDIYESDNQDGLAAADGTHYLSFGHNGTYGGYVYQSFATTVGALYHVSFYIAEQQGDDPSQQFSACISPDGSSCSDFHTYGSLTDTFRKVTFDFTATSTTTGLGITDTTPAGGGGPSNLALDMVSVTTGAGGVPEPASWMTMVAGVGLLGGTFRRRKFAPAT